MPVSLLRPIPPRVEVPPTPQCEFRVTILGHHDREWRKNRYGERWNQCSHPAVVELDGTKYCRRHAGQIVLDQYLEGKLTETAVEQC